MPDTTFIGEIGAASIEPLGKRRVAIGAEARAGGCLPPRIGLRVDRRSVAARFVEQENAETVPGRGDGRGGSRGTRSDDDEIVARVQFSRAKP
jgi:hypothetical protein